MTYVDLCAQAATRLVMDLRKAGIIGSDQVPQTRRAIVIALEQTVRTCCTPPESVDNPNN